MFQLDPRQVVLNALAALAPIRDPLRRIRTGDAAPNFEKLVDVALASIDQRRRFLGAERIRGAQILEIGSGRDVSLALLFVALGARRVVNVEIDRFWFIDDARLYRRLVERAAAAGIPIAWPPAGLVPGADESKIQLDPERIQLYLGESATSIPEPDASMDVTLSLAVLEHVRGRDMRPVARELRRLTRPGGIGLHRIDLVDHYTRAAQPFRFLRFSPLEYELMYGNRGSSSNRMRIDDFDRVFSAEGFGGVRFDEVVRYEDAAQFSRWEQSFHPDFRGRDAVMMRAKECLMVITPERAAASTR